MRMPLSVLDLALVTDGETSATGLAAATKLAQLADRLGFTRFWVAEHHNMSSVASTEPPVLMAHLAANTEQIRVGSGGVMLPNHAPLVVAEQFAMLEALYPGRVDLGIGRAPGTDRNTMMALRRTSDGSEEDQFPQHVLEVMALLGDVRIEGGLHEQFKATPLLASTPLVALLGSSGFSARLAGLLGLPFGFAHHFGMGGTTQAAEIYRENFRPSPALAEPHLIVTAVAVCANTGVAADALMDSHRLFKYGLRTGQAIGFLSHDDAVNHPAVEAARSQPPNAIYGTPTTVVEGLEVLAEETGATELMVTVPVPNLNERLESLELLGNAWGLNSKSDRALAVG